MIQNLILGSLILLCILLIISLIRKPFDDRIKNPCGFKILPPKFDIVGTRKKVSFQIVVEKRHKYFINFPLKFRFYSEKKFKADTKIYYATPGENRQLILDRQIEYTSKTKEYVVYITDVIVGKILIDVELDIDIGASPTILFEIMENSTCRLVKEHKLEIKFPES
jgi:hypothetical protein